MEIHFFDSKNKIVHFSEFEKEALKKIIQIVMSDLEEELGTRTGYSEEEYSLLLNKISSLTVDEKVVLNIDELRMIRQIMGEMYYGIDLAYILSGMGTTYAEQLIKNLGNEIESLKDNS